MPRLRVEQHEQPPREIVLRGAALTIGRGIGNDVHLRDPWLSREHARIEPDGGGWRLVDLGSRNGTWVNGERVAEACALDLGDVVTLGDVRLSLVDDQATGVRLAEGNVSLEREGTVMISSDELRFDRFHRERRADPTRADEADLLPVLNEVASALVSHFPVDELAEKVLDLVLDAVPAERAALLLRPRGALAGDAGARGSNGSGSNGSGSKGETDGALEVKASRGYGEAEEVTISRTIARVVMEEKQALLTMDAQSDERFDRAVSIMMQGIRSILCAPLVDNNREVTGLLYLDDRLATPVFSERALRLVGLIASLAAVKIENCHLLEDQIEKRRMEEQLALGAQIQRRLLPIRAPVIEGYDLWGRNRSCYEVGGDYFDFIEKDDGRLAIVVADISGKGVGAALLMAALQASLRALIDAVDNPANLVHRLNRVLVENSPDNKFATLFYAELDRESHVLEYVSGGHNPALLAVDGEIRELGPTGPIVGLISEARFECRRLDLPPGATLLVYTDGVTELARDEKGDDELGVEPLFEILRAGEHADAKGLVGLVQERMVAFVQGSPFDDDATLVVVRRLPSVEATE